MNWFINKKTFFHITYIFYLKQKNLNVGFMV